MPLTLRPATPADLPDVRALFRAYGESLGYDLCFQGFDEELAGLPGRYAPPDGRLLVAELRGPPVACVALRKLDDQTCEMKRLFVLPEARGHGAGRTLTLRVIEEARSIGYRRLVLDTLPTMGTAISLYRDLGFTPIEPYYSTPISGTLFLQLELEP